MRGLRQRKQCHLLYASVPRRIYSQGPLLAARPQQAPPCLAPSRALRFIVFLSGSATAAWCVCAQEGPAQLLNTMARDNKCKGPRLLWMINMDEEGYHAPSGSSLTTPEMRARESMEEQARCLGLDSPRLLCRQVVHPPRPSGRD